jgi:hypothetical protein
MSRKYVLSPLASLHKKHIRCGGISHGWPNVAAMYNFPAGCYPEFPIYDIHRLLRGRREHCTAERRGRLEGGVKRA